MLYEIKFDNTKNIKLNENIFNCSIKIAILNKTFTNRDEAEDYICDRAEKWCDALAVTVQTEDETYTSIGGWCAS